MKNKLFGKLSQIFKGKDKAGFTGYEHLTVYLEGLEIREEQLKEIEKFIEENSEMDSFLKEKFMKKKNGYKEIVEAYKIILRRFKY